MKGTTQLFLTPVYGKFMMYYKIYSLKIFIRRRVHFKRSKKLVVY